MNTSLVSRIRPLILATCLSSVPFAAKADLLPDGLLGVKLGQPRVEAVTALVNAGVVPDSEKAHCSDKVPEKNIGFADRICKLVLQPGSLYQDLPVTKVTFLFKDESLVLMGLYVGESDDTFGKLRNSYLAQFGAITVEESPKILRWVEAPDERFTRKTKVGLWADEPNAFIVYAYEDIR